MDEPRQSLADMVSLSANIERQQEINASNIGGFLQTLEHFFRDEVRLSENVWVDQGIWEDSPTIFGWSQVDGDWHITVGERETCVDPDGERVLYASSTKKVVDCDAGVQMQVFRKVKLLIDEIDRTLQARHARTKAEEQEIVQQIRSVAERLGNGDGPNQPMNLTGPASRLLNQ